MIIRQDNLCLINFVFEYFISFTAILTDLLRHLYNILSISAICNFAFCESDINHANLFGRKSDWVPHSA